jgi:hypothetical protein
VRVHYTLKRANEGAATHIPDVQVLGSVER